MYRLMNKVELLVTPKIGGEICVGSIKDTVLNITDKDNYHIESQSLGIDEEILLDEDLIFKLINIKFRGKILLTSRLYFIDHGIRKTLINGRDQSFLKISEFGLSKALKYEQGLQYAKLATLDVFDILQLDNPRVYREWEKAMNQKFKNKSKESEKKNG